MGKIKREKGRAFSDVLPYFMSLEDGVMLLKDGSLMSTYKYLGDDPESLGPSDRDTHIEIVNSVLSRLTDGWSLYVDSFRFPVTGYFEKESHFPNQFLQDLDDERRFFYTQNPRYDSEYYLSLIYTPPTEKVDKFGKIFIADGDMANKTSMEKHISYFKEQCNSFVNLMSSAVKMNMLSNSEQVDYFRYAIYGERVKSRSLNEFMFLDTLIGNEVFVTGFKPKLKGKRIVSLSIIGYPDVMNTDDLMFLNSLSMKYRWTVRFIYLNTDDALRSIDSVKQKWLGKNNSVFSFIASALKHQKPEETVSQSDADMNAAATLQVADARMALLEAGSNKVKFGLYTSTITITGDTEDEISANIKYITKVLNDHHFIVKEELVNATETFLGSIPGNLYFNLRRPLFHTLNLAGIMPMFSYWTGYKKCPSDKIQAIMPDAPALSVLDSVSVDTPFYFNFYYHDIGHTAIFGPTGGGKTTILEFIASQFLKYPKARVYYVDKDYSSYIFTRCAGGEHFDIFGPTQSTGMKFNPFKYLLEGDVEVAWISDFVEILLKLQGKVTDSSVRNKINDALQALVAKKVVPSMTDFVRLVQDNEIRESLRFYTRDSGSAIGSLLDNQFEPAVNGFFTNYEMSHILGMSEKVLNPVLLNIFKNIEHSLDGSPTLIVLDEAWSMLRDKMFVEVINNWLRVLRKLNGAVIFATQSLTEVMNSDISSVIMESCKTRILLPNVDAQVEAISAIYKRFGLTDSQIGVIADLGKSGGHYYYYMSPDTKRVLDLNLTKYALLHFSSDINKVKAALNIPNDVNFLNTYDDLCRRKVI